MSQNKNWDAYMIQEGVIVLPPDVRDILGIKN